MVQWEGIVWAELGNTYMYSAAEQESKILAFLHIGPQIFILVPEPKLIGYMAEIDRQTDTT